MIKIVSFKYGGFNLRNFWVGIRLTEAKFFSGSWFILYINPLPAITFYVSFYTYKVK